MAIKGTRGVHSYRAVSYTHLDVYKRQDHTNLLIGVSGSKEAADCCAAAKDSGKYFSRAEGKYDRYFIRIDASRPQGDIVILGENAQAAFFGLATLEQMLEQKKDGKLTAVTIYDYSDTQYRGFIEGFYGYPWDMEDRISLMEYGKRFKMNVYIYGPKSDPYPVSYTHLHTMVGSIW